jgi:hypothetical protein
MNFLLTTNSYKDRTQVLTRKVRQLADLPLGFSHGEGLPITRPAIENAERFIMLASRYRLDADVFPNLDGGCAVAFYKNSERTEISIGPQGELIDLRVEHGIGFQFTDVIPPVDNVELADVINQLERLWRLDNDIWKLSASSISVNLTERSGGFGTLSTKTHQNPKGQLLPMAEGAFQSLNYRVLVEA